MGGLGAAAGQGTGARSGGGGSGTTGAGGGGAGAGGSSASKSSIYEAEHGFFSGGASLSTALAGFTGAGYVAGIATASERVVFTVHVAEAGAVDGSLRYNNASAQPAPLTLIINGSRVGEVALAATGEEFSSYDVTLDLRAGLNTVIYVNEAGSASVAIDHLELLQPSTLAPRGATVPFTIYEAEAGATDGAVIGPDRSYGTVAAEASGRRAVKLEADGAYVEHTLERAANALVVRYSMPDAPSGGGSDGSLGVYVDGTKRGSLALSSKYAWVYGAYPYDNDPSHADPHRYFDDARLLIGDAAAGSTLRLQKEAGDPIPYYTVDLLELEQAAEPYPQPAGSLSIESYGATAGDASDDTQAIIDALADGKLQDKAVFMPAGEYSLSARIDIDGVKLRGAGPWYSVLRGANGKGGFNGLGGTAELLDFALFGDVSYRDDANFDASIDGALGPGSMLQNLWFEHTKVGIWTNPADSTLIVGCRIRNTFADGINLTNGTRRTMVEQNHLRNTGDDALAMWSNGNATEANVFRSNSVGLPMLANGIAIYGGSDNRIEDNLVTDTVIAAAGIAISTRAEFNPQPFAGTTTVERNTLTRSGGYEENWQTEFGGLWIFANGSAITSGLIVRDLDILDSSYQGLLLSGEQPIQNALFERVSIQGATSFGIEIVAPGAATFREVTVSEAAAGGAQIAEVFAADKATGNSGW